MLKMSSQYNGDMYNQQQLHFIKLFVVFSIIRIEQDYKSFRSHLIPSGKEEKAGTIPPGKDRRVGSLQTLGDDPLLYPHDCNSNVQGLNVIKLDYINFSKTI